MEFRDDLEWIDYDPIGFNIHVGPFFIASVGGGVYRMHLMIEPRHLNQGGVVHGGVSMTLADNAMGMSARFEAGGTPASTIEFGMKFIAAAKAGGPLYGAARVERRTPDVCFMTGELWSDGRKTATASGVWKYLKSNVA
ncbi:PaaI family thioesterase [Pikeienuella sp. HZG-20]|uniref:PaaI family thioesterase n=1 Tax=Paludibacillus litoralis TaxID=3133267 RepID=UPI0030ED809A